MNKELLILEFQQQDVLAYEKLYKTYCKSISGVLNTIVKDAEATEEITQNVFLKAWNCVASYFLKQRSFFYVVIEHCTKCCN
jgi:RNA polymerase sigma-70 factor (ECF subfamily)